MRRYQKQLRWCAGIYVVGCFFRAVWPRIDVERICFFDSPISVTLVGRSLATVAELCFAWQIGLVLKRLAHDLATPAIQRIAPSPDWAVRIVSAVGHVAFPAIFVAQ